MPPVARRLKGFGAVALSVALGACAVSVQTMQVDGAARAPVIEGFGGNGMVVTTSSEKALRLFRQGLEQAYAFNEAEAVRAFKAALAEDHSCAMCAWGVAYQLGPTLIRPGRGDLAEAVRYAALAKRLADNASALERALIDAMVLRYAQGMQAASMAVEFAPTCAPGQAAAKSDPLEMAYAASLRQVASAYPNDPDIQSFYAEAEMLATPGKKWSEDGTRPVGRVGEIVDMLERMLQAHPTHTGLNHYMTHVADVNAVAHRAIPAAERLGTLAPASPHLLHMGSHIFARVGRYNDATQANASALASEDALDASLRAQGFEPVKNWRPHNSQFLMFAALLEGRGETALGMARTSAQQAVGGGSSMAEFAHSQPLLAQLRLERYNELLQEAQPEGRQGVAAALYLYARGVALARTGQATQAASALAKLAPQVEQVLKSHPSDTFPHRMVRSMAHVALEELRAEVAAQEGRADEALAHAGKAAAAGELLDSVEPAMFSGSPRLALGEMQLRQQRWVEAEATFRSDLAIHPRSG